MSQSVHRLTNSAFFIRKSIYSHHALNEILVYHRVFLHGVKPNERRNDVKKNHKKSPVCFFYVNFSPAISHSFIFFKSLCIILVKINLQKYNVLLLMKFVHLNLPYSYFLSSHNKLIHTVQNTG